MRMSETPRSKPLGHCTYSQEHENAASFSEDVLVPYLVPERFSRFVCASSMSVASRREARCCSHRVKRMVCEMRAFARSASRRPQ